MTMFTQNAVIKNLRKERKKLEDTLEARARCNIDCYKDWVKKGRPIRLPNKEAEN